MTTLTLSTTPANLAEQVAAVLSAMRRRNPNSLAMGVFPHLTNAMRTSFGAHRWVRMRPGSNRLDVAGSRRETQAIAGLDCHTPAVSAGTRSEAGAGPDAPTHDRRLDRAVGSLRSALRAIVNGPEYTDGQVVGPNVLLDTLKEPFAGRGGLRNNESRLAELEIEIAQARQQVDASLMAAIALIG